MDIIQIHNKNELDILKGKQAFFEKLKFEFLDDQIATLKDNLDKKNAFQIMIKDKNEFYGYASGYETEWREGFLFLHELFVNPNHQRKGIGKKLVSKFIEKARRIDLNGVMTQTEFENIPAQKLYEKIGFVKIENKDRNEGITYRLLFNDNKE